MTPLRRTLSSFWLVCTAAALSAPLAGAAPDTPGTCDPEQGPIGCAGQPPQTWPLAQGDFSSAGDPGWVYFTRRSGGSGCGIGPDGTIGCDIVPSRWPDGTPVQAGQPGPPGSYGCGDAYCPLPPPGANQIVAGPQQRAEYAQSDTPTFTRDVGVLTEGYRVANGEAWCAVGYQGTVDCSTGEHGFTVSALGVTFR